MNRKEIRCKDVTYTKINVVQIIQIIVWVFVT